MAKFIATICLLWLAVLMLVGFGARPATARRHPLLIEDEGARRNRPAVNRMRNGHTLLGGVTRRQDKTKKKKNKKVNKSVQQQKKGQPGRHNCRRRIASPGTRSREDTSTVENCYDGCRKRVWKGGENESYTALLNLASSDQQHPLKMHGSARLGGREFREGGCKILVTTDV
uniref:Uncharacterized protein n=1 Tax=Anopheles atroparvus TaxID=41427 RepID=A0A182JFQ5_ANOAO